MENHFLDLAVSGVHGLTPYPAGKPISEVQRELGLNDLVKLASNENSYGASPKVFAALQESLTELHYYPDANGYFLKNKLADFLDVSSENITLGNGSNELIELIARTFVSANHEIIFSEYAFIIYEMICQAIGATPKKIPAKNWGHQLDKMAEAVSSKTRLIFIANPNNPTGTWVSHDILADLLKGLPEHVLVVVDEAYYEYVDEKTYPNSLELQKKHPNLIVLRTFSKAYALAGLRVGYCVSHPDIANLLNRIRQPFNVNSLAQRAAEVALSDQNHLQNSIKNNQQEIQVLAKGVEELGLAYIPSAANFLTIDVQQDAMVLFQKLLRKGVIVRPVVNYGMPTHLRVTVGIPCENQRFLQALSQSR